MIAMAKAKAEAVASTSGTSTKKVSRVVVSKAQRLAVVRAEAILLNKEADTLRAELLAVAGSATTLIHNNLVVVSIAERSARRFDEAEFAKAYPELHEAFMVEKTSQVVNVPKQD
jgi:hypothetical protein